MSKMRKLALAVLALLVVTLCGCQKNESVELSQTAPIFEDGAVVGEGETEFEFSVKYDDGKVDRCTVKTDKKTVGEALLENDIITGEDGAYGLYVKSVNGVVADFDKTGTYWAFYVNGEYATNGVDSTEIKDGEKYSFEIGK